MTSRYNHKYVAFIDGLYINELCDTDDEKEFFSIVKEYGQVAGFVAYIGDERLQ